MPSPGLAVLIAGSPNIPLWVGPDTYHHPEVTAVIHDGSVTVTQGYENLPVPTNPFYSADLGYQIANSARVNLAIALRQCGYEVRVEAFTGGDDREVRDLIERARRAGLEVNEREVSHG